MPLGLGAGIERGYEYMAQQDRDTENRRRYDQEAARRAQQDEQDRMAKQAQAERQARQDAFERTKFDKLSAYRESQIAATAGNQQRAQAAHDFTMGEKKAAADRARSAEDLYAALGGARADIQELRSGRPTNLSGMANALNSLAKITGSSKTVASVTPRFNGSFDVTDNAGNEFTATPDQVFQEYQALEKASAPFLPQAAGSSRSRGTGSRAGGTPRPPKSGDLIQTHDEEGKVVGTTYFVTPEDQEANRKASKLSLLESLGRKPATDLSLGGWPEDVPSWQRGMAESLAHMISYDQVQATGVHPETLKAMANQPGNVLRQDDINRLSGDIKAAMKSKDVAARYEQLFQSVFPAGGDEAAAEKAAAFATQKLSEIVFNEWDEHKEVEVAQGKKLPFHPLTSEKAVPTASINQPATESLNKIKSNSGTLMEVAVTKEELSPKAVKRWLTLQQRAKELSELPPRERGIWLESMLRDEEIEDHEYRRLARQLGVKTMREAGGDLIHRNIGRPVYEALDPVVDAVSGGLDKFGQAVSNAEDLIKYGGGMPEGSWLDSIIKKRTPQPETQEDSEESNPHWLKFYNFPRGF